MRQHENCFNEFVMDILNECKFRACFGYELSGGHSLQCTFTVCSLWSRYKIPPCWFISLAQKAEMFSNTKTSTGNTPHFCVLGEGYKSFACCPILQLQKLLKI